MELLIIVIVLLVLFGGGGGYYYYNQPQPATQPANTTYLPGVNVGGILWILIVVILVIILFRYLR